MSFGDMLQTALSNLTRRWVRTILTSLGVVVGILTIVTMVSLGVGVQREVRAQFAVLGLENVLVQPRVDREAEEDFFTQFARPARLAPITPEVIAQWQQRESVVSVTPSISLGGVNTLLEIPNAAIQRIEIDSGGDLFANNPFRTPPTALAGSIASPPPGSVVLGQGAVGGQLPERLIGQQATVILSSPRGEEQRFLLTIAGVSSFDENILIAHPNDMAAMKSWWFNLPDYVASEGYDSAVIRAVDVGEAANLVRELRAANFRVQSLELILETANRTFAVINVMLSSVGGLALFVASLGIVNTMLMAIYERTREIGTLKAIGASRGDIRNLFMIEAGLIGMIGGVVGVIGGWLAGIGLNQLINWYIEREELPLQATFFVTPLWLVGLALGFATLIGIVAGLYPAARAARLDPLVALRYE